MNKALSSLLQIGLCTSGCLYATGNITLAQVTSDGTVNTQVTEKVSENGNVSEITGGETRGSNLFHSFRDFSVETGNEAVFNNADSISNIFSRVTGGNISNIDGLIRANGSASLFLINPAGIIFGENARLDIGGSFYGSSADSILFEDGEFSATDLDNPPVLTVNAPIGLNLRDEPGDIAINGNENAKELADFSLLSVLKDQSLNLIGGDIDLNNAILSAPGGNVTLGGLQTSGTVNINENGNLNFPENLSRGNISLDNSNVFVNFVSDGEGGSISLNANNIELLNASSLQNGIDANSGFAEAQAGDINLNAIGKIDINGASRILNIVDSDATGNAGNINLTTNAISLSGASGIISSVNGNAEGNAGDITVNITESSKDGGSLNATGGSYFQTDTFGQGDAGNITINGETASVSFDGTSFDGTNPETYVSSGIFSLVRNLTDPNTKQQFVGSGNSGQIKITADSLSLDNGAQIKNSLDTKVVGQGNDLNLTANTISLSGTSKILSGVGLNAVGRGGNIEITADTLSLSEASAIATDTSGQAGENGRADAGDITVNITESPQDGGSLKGTGGSYFQTDTFGQGDAGNITINGKTASVSFDGTNPETYVSSGIFSSVRSNVDSNIFGSGNSGQITINANSLSLANGAQIRNSLDPGVVGQGNDLNLTANTISLSGTSKILSGVGLNAVGRGGNIEITADTLSLSEASAIATDTSGQAGENGRGSDAGDITVNITESSKDGGSLNATGGSYFQTDTFGQGNAGNITINGETASVSFDGTNPETSVSSGISSSVGNFTDPNTKQQFVGSGNSGQVTLNADSLSLDNFGLISASTSGQGDAGNISINVDKSISLFNSSNIRSVVGQEGIGNAGDIDIEASSLTIRGGSQIGTAVFRSGFEIPGGVGKGGNITINARDFVDIAGVGTVQLNIPDNSGDADNTTGLFPTEGFSSGLIANSERGASGDAGNVEVTTGAFRIADGAVVDSLTANKGNGGNIIINADTFEATGGGQILTTARSSGNAGSIKLNIEDSISISGSDPNFESRLARAKKFGPIQGGGNIVNNQGAESGVFANTEQNSTGNGGNISIGIFKQEGDALVFDNTQFTENLMIFDGGRIAADSQGEGNGGTISIRAKDLTLDNQAEILAETSFPQAGENPTPSEITLEIENTLRLRNYSTISAQANNNARGGNVNIDANFIIAYPDGNNDVLANSAKGQGGAIDINAESLFGIQEREPNPSTNDIDASSGVEGLGGSVNITISDINPVQGATELPTNTVELGQTRQQACEANREGIAKNGLTIEGKGGVPPAPDLPLNSQSISINGEVDPSISNIPEPIETSIGKIQPARGIKISKDGRVTLTAYRTNNAGERIPEIEPNCNRY